MPKTATSDKGSRHRPRAMVALVPDLNEILSDYAKEHKQPARWSLHDILLRFFVEDDRITQGEADLIWARLTERKKEG